MLHDGEVLAGRMNRTGSNHAALLPVYVEELQAEAVRRGLKLDGVVLSEGPGSYTGLRIGASLAKGLCYGADIPLIAVPTLAVIADAAITAIHGTEDSDNQNFMICPMIDARRMEVYCAVYDGRLNEVQPLKPVVVDEQSFAQLLKEHVIYFCGNGAEKCKGVLTHPNARWIDGIVPTGAQAGKMYCAPESYGKNSWARVIEGKDIAYYEPNYLKEFVAAPSHVKGLK